MNETIDVNASAKADMPNFFDLIEKENIKRLRKEKKITQGTLTDIFNVTSVVISKWENNI